MPGVASDELVKKLIEEAEGYLPAMRDSIQVLETNKMDKSPLKELHRLSNLINGAALMVELDDLGSAASKLKNILDDAMNTTGPVSIKFLDAANKAIDNIATYCRTFSSSGIKTETQLANKPALLQGAHIHAIPTALNIPDVPIAMGEESSDLVDEMIEGQSKVKNESKSMFFGPVYVELIQSLHKEMSEHLTNINDGLHVLLSQVKSCVGISEDYREIVLELSYSVRTLMENAVIIGIEPVATWGYEFENFLDWLHDESNVLTAEIIFAMLDGTDILEKIVDTPAMNVDTEISKIKDVFQIIIDDLQKNSAKDSVVTLENEQTPIADLVDSGKDILTEDISLQFPDETDVIDLDIESADFFAESDTSDELASDIETISKDVISEPFGIDQELQESFDAEAEEHLENIGRNLNQLSTAIADTTIISDDYRKKLHSIMRSVHTLKGAAAVIGIEPVAAWGHDFENFLDWLHDESDVLTVEIISAMLDGTDILEKIVDNPAMDVDTEISEIKDIFQGIIDGLQKTSAEDGAVTLEKEQTPVTNLTDEVVEEGADISIEGASLGSEKKHLKRPQSVGIKEKREEKRKKSIRVDVDKIDGMMGLSGDMSINLSGFKNSLFFMQSTLTEFEIILQRVKKIASSLESDYELATIPHLAAVAESGSGQMSEEFDPLEMDRYSELHILIRSLNEAIVDLDSIRDQNSKVHDSWRLNVEKQRLIFNDVQSTMEDIKMTPFSGLFNRLYKTVRESSRVTGKPVQLDINGGATEIDSHVWDTLADPMMHMLRNAVDHGIEETQDRLRAGKPEQATIRINCFRQGGRIILRLSDDGRGLDYDAIRSRALTLYPGTGVEQMDSGELAALIFKQGFSIRTQVTTMSGRGVGMDVVRDAVERLSGFVEVISEPGKSTEFVLSLPIAMAQFSSLLVMFGSWKFAIPMRDIAKVFRISNEERTKVEFELDGEMLPLINPAEILRGENGLQPSTDANIKDDNSLALAVDIGGKRGVLVTDTVVGKRDIVFKNLGAHLKNVPYVAGATIMGDGTLIPILKTEDLFDQGKTSVFVPDNVGKEISSEEKSIEILIVDDSISIRKVLSSFISGQGWHPVTAHDGIDAMEKVRESKPNLVILDIEMPRMNGFEVLHSLQSQPAYRDIPILMLTSRSAEKYRVKAVGLGARGFITKPFKPVELTSLITDIIDPKSANKK